MTAIEPPISWGGARGGVNVGMAVPCVVSGFLEQSPTGLTDASTAGHAAQCNVALGGRQLRLPKHMTRIAKAPLLLLEHRLVGGRHLDLLLPGIGKQSTRFPLEGESPLPGEGKKDSKSRFRFKRTAESPWCWD